MVPEVIPLRVRIGQVRFGHTKDSLPDVRAARGSVAKLLPVIQPAASDDIVYCGKCPIGVVQMTVQHAIGL